MSLTEPYRHDLKFPYHHLTSSIERLDRIRTFVAEHDDLADNAGPKDVMTILETKVARLLGMEAAIWFPTGTMAQAAAARIHLACAQNRQVLLHPTSHLLLHEEEGYRMAHMIKVQIGGNWREPMHTGLIHEDVGCVFVELPQRHSGGRLPAWSTLQDLKTACTERDIKLHMDGARLWSCRPFYGGRSYAEIAAGFDSVYVSLYKDIGALSGAVLAGTRKFCDEATLWRTRFGGLLPAAWPMIVDALSLIDKRLEQMDIFVAKAREMATVISTTTALQVDPLEPHVNMFHIMLEHPAERVIEAMKTVAKDAGVMMGRAPWAYEARAGCALEVTIGEKAMDMPIEIWAQAVKCLADRCKND